MRGNNENTTWDFPIRELNINDVLPKVIFSSSHSLVSPYPAELDELIFICRYNENTCLRLEQLIFAILSKRYFVFVIFRKKIFK